ncbi:MAG TPA: DUF3597 family protein [Burkholderiales bacterium]
MGIFSAILDKLRHHGSASGSQASAGQPTATSAQQQPQQQPQQQGQASVQQQAQPSAQSGLQGSSQAPLQNVDIDAVLSQLASNKGGGGNYRQSIVDLLKLLDLDSSLGARKELAEELNVHAGAHGSAEQNIALHKAVMRKVAENGGKVPDSMKH